MSDFHKMAVTVLKSTYTKAKPKEVYYRDYKGFDEDTFRRELQEASHKRKLSLIKNLKLLS